MGLAANNAIDETESLHRHDRNSPARPMTSFLEQSGTTLRMRSRKLMMVTVMIIVSLVYLLTYYSGQGNTVSGATLSLGDGGQVVANHHSFQYLLNKPHLCSGAGDSNGRVRATSDANVNNMSWTTETPPETPPVLVHTVIMVVTAPSNFATRLAIRQTWGTLVQNKDYRLAFVMGQPEDSKVQAKIVDEDTTYGDIIQENFADTYRNLTLKSIAILKWVDSYCRNSKFVIKIDDDCFLNVAIVRSYLDGRKETRTIFGRVWQKVKPIRDEKDKWHVTKEEFDGDAFPDYVGGPTYAMTTDAVPDLYAASMHTSGQQAHFVLEDVYVTGMCADKAKVARVTDTKFGVADPPTTCSARSAISFHRVQPDVMFLLWWLVNDSKLDAVCTTAKTKDTAGQQCSKAANALVDITNLVIKNVHGS